MSDTIRLIVYGVLGLIMLGAVIRIIYKRFFQKSPGTIAPPAPIPMTPATPVQPAQTVQTAAPAPVKTAAPRVPPAMTQPVATAAALPASRDGYHYGALTPMLASLLPENATRQAAVRKELVAAGEYSPHAYENLSATRYLGIIVPLLLFGVLLILAPPLLENWVIGLLVVVPILGFSLPRLMLQSQGRARMEEIERAMPDMLDMLNMCVSQGLTVPESLQRVATELQPVYPALSQELQIVVEQSRLGSLEQALENLSRRVEVPEVHSFASLIIQTERMGTSVSTALSEYSDNMRESLRQRADERANSASFKLLFPTVLCLMPAVYLFLLGPAVVELSDFFSGESSQALRSNQEAMQSLNRPVIAPRTFNRPSGRSNFP